LAVTGQHVPPEQGGEDERGDTWEARETDGQVTRKVGKLGGVEWKGRGETRKGGA